MGHGLSLRGLYRPLHCNDHTMSGFVLWNLGIMHNSLSDTKSTEPLR